MRRFYWAILSIFLSAAEPSAAAAPNVCETLFNIRIRASSDAPWKWGQILGITETDLLDRMPVVHVTRFMPVSGIVRAGDAPQAFRPEVHFALGEVVRSHPDGLWEEMPYAVVTNLRRLEPQLLNLMTYDTYILGDFKLNRSDYLVIPIQDAAKAPRGVNVVTYDPQQKRIRQAVDELIARLNWLAVRGKDGMGRIHHPATLHEHNVNLPSFFAPILARNPHVSFGGHAKSQVGAAAAFGHLDLRWLSKQNFGEGGSTYGVATENLELELDLARNALRKVERLASFYPTQSQEAFTRQRARLIRYMNLATADIKLRKAVGRSIRYAAPGYSKDDLLASAESAAQLERYLQTIIDKIPVIKKEKIWVSDYLIEDLTFLAPREFEAMVAKHSGVFTSEVKDFARLAYGLQKFLIVGYKRAAEEGLLPLLENAALSALNHDVPYFFREIWKTYFMGEHFGPESSRLNDVLKLFNQPSMREFLSAKMDMHLPPKTDLTLQDILVSHPNTRDAYKPYPASFTDPRIVRFLRAVPLGGWRGIDYTPLVHEQFGLAAVQMRQTSLGQLKGHEGPVLPPFIDFAMAEAAATARSTTRDPFEIERFLHEIPAQVAPVAEPRGFPMLGDSILTALRHQPEKLTEMWAKLGLETQFRRRFPTDEAFWQSEKPLYQIYIELLR